MTMKNYYDIDGLENLYLEDSFVLGVAEQGVDIVFNMEFVLTENHPLYHKPRIGEHYCYRKGQLRFVSPTFIKWERSGKRGFIDKNKEVDFGNIDSFVSDGNKFILSGDWGELEISPENIVIDYE